MGNLSVFKNDRFGQIRVAGTSEQPLFCAADLCESLGFSNPRDAVRNHVDDRDVAKYDTPIANQYGTEVMQKLTYVNESGMYALIFGSKKPEAKEFKYWVTSEVLPSIRNHGAYMTDDAIQRTLTDPDYLIQLATVLKEEKQKRIQAETKVAILTHTNKTYTASEIAKEIGMRSAKELNKWLELQHVQYKVNETWVPCAKYSGLAWFEIKQEELDNGHIVYHRKITGLGREGIIDLFKKHQQV